jgi:hypothetical protein
MKEFSTIVLDYVGVRAVAKDGIRGQIPAIPLAYGRVMNKDWLALNLLR